MNRRKYNYVVENLDQLESMKFCPYCGSDTMYVYLGDWHNYTVCLECEDELEFMTVMKEVEEKMEDEMDIERIKKYETDLENGDVETYSHDEIMKMLGLLNEKNNTDDELAFWIEEGNSETFARAWLDGYKVEEEQKYIVALPSEVEHDDMWPKVALSKLANGKLKVHKTSRQTDLTLQDKYLLTEKEIKDYEPKYWLFAKKVER